MANIQEEIEILENLDNLVNDIREETITNGDMLGNKVQLSNKILTAFHVNIRSIKKNFNELTSFLETYNLKYCDVIVLTESWQLECGDNFCIEGYTMYYNKADFNKNDGTVVYIRSNLKHTVTHTKLNLSKVTLTDVGLSVGGVSVRVSCMYRPPSSSTPHFLSDIEAYFSAPITSQIDVLLGDINLNLLDEHSDEIVTYTSILNHFGLVSAINSPTRVTTDSSTNLDHIFLRKNVGTNLKYSSFIIQSAITDHYPTMLNINSTSENQANGDMSIAHTFTKINYMLLGELIENHNFDSIYNTQDSDSALTILNETISDALNQAKSYKTYSLKKIKKIKPWITNGIITSIKKRDTMKKKLLRYNTLENKTAFKAYRNNLQNVIKKSKHDFYKAKILNSGTDIRKIYKVINEATDSNIAHRDIDLNITDNNVAFGDSLGMANFCNEFFVNIGYNMYRKIKSPPDPLRIESTAPYSMFLRPTNKFEIIKQIASLKNNCAPGVDGITSLIVKHLHTHIAAPLAHVINLIFRTAKVPKSFKVAIVKPIHKSGDRTNIGNYRPISIINTFAKIFEKCLKDRLVEFFHHNKTLSERQFGFVSGLGTTDAVCELCKQVTHSLDSGKRCLAVFLDLAKAFDTVPHDLLLQVLESYGVRGAVLDVFADYLRDRTQSVKVGHTMSDPLKIKIGIPQGTVLGPILFVAYINSLTNISTQNGSVISYADDTAVVFSGETWDSVRNYATDGINKIKHWLDSFKLSLNASKTNYIAFSLTSVNQPEYNSLFIDGLDSHIAQVDSTKYLGIVIDKNLKWDQHVLRLTKNIRKLIYKFYSIREILNKQLLILVYKGIVESLLRYGLVVWGGLYQNALSHLSIAQNYILKVIFRKNRRFSTALLYSREVFDVRSLYCLSTCIYVHKSDKFKNFISHQYQTRSNVNKHLETPVASTTKKLRSIFYLAPKMYNLLPPHIKQLNLKRFCVACRDYIYVNLETFKDIFT